MKKIRSHNCVQFKVVITDLSSAIFWFFQQSGIQNQLFRFDLFWVAINFDMYPNQAKLKHIMLKRKYDSTFLLFFSWEEAWNVRAGMLVCISYVYVFSPFFLLYLWTWQSKLSIIKLVSELWQEPKLHFGEESWGFCAHCWCAPPIQPTLARARR